MCKYSMYMLPLVGTKHEHNLHAFHLGCTMLPSLALHNASFSALHNLPILCTARCSLEVDGSLPAKRKLDESSQVSRLHSKLTEGVPDVQKGDRS